MEYRRIIPNSISGTNLILGVLSIFESVVSIFESVAGNFEWAAIYIILAVAVDACDGRAARALGVAGKFGVEMDSLCDVCSFGVAPAVMMYYYGMTASLLLRCFRYGALCAWRVLTLMPMLSTVIFRACLFPAVPAFWLRSCFPATTCRRAMLPY